MKKSDKPVLIKAFDQFCEQNNYCIASSLNTQLYIKPILKERDKTSDHDKDQLLFKDKLNQIQYHEKILDFANFLFEHENYKHLGLRFLIEKTPTPESRDYYPLTRDIVKILREQEDVLFDYVGRQSYIKNNRSDMIDLFSNGFLNQSQREAIIEMYVNLESFSELKNKVVIHEMIEKFIDNNEKYQSYFTQLHEAQEKLETVNLIEEAQKCEIYTMKFDLHNLMLMSPTTSENQLITSLNLLEELKDYYDQLGITKIITDKAQNKENQEGKTMNIHCLGHNINEKFLNKFFNTYVKEILVNPQLRTQVYVVIADGMLPPVHTFITDCIRISNAYILDDKINTLLPLPEKTKQLKKKI